MSARFFHSCPLLLESGSVVQPGNWGRILNCYRQPNVNNGWMLAREMTYEAIRSSEFPGRPSRLSSAFIFESLEHANQYKSQFSPWNPLYEVELINPDALSHKAGFNLIQFPGDHTEFLPVVVSCARDYWRGREITVPEILTKSPLKVMAMISSGPGSYQP
jgi:hypothetical protein